LLPSPELETYSVWDQEPDTGGVMVLSQLVRRQMETLSRVRGQSEDLFQLRKKVSSLEVMLQKINLEREPTPETKTKKYRVLFEKNGCRVCSDKTGLSS